MVRNLEVKTACKNVLQPQPIFPSWAENPTGSTVRAEGYAQLRQSCALRSVARNQSASFPFLLFPQPQLFPCCPPKLLSRGDLLRPGSKPRQRQHAKVNKRGTNSTSVSSGMFVAACVFHLQRTSQDSLRSCIFDTSQPAQTIRSVVLTGDNVSGRPGPETWREMVKVKAIRGSYSTAALRHIVLLPK